jgi:hypothetical protein
VTTLSHDEARALIHAHFGLDTSFDDERALRLHLAACTACSARYERHLLVASLDPEAASAERRLAAGLGLKPGGARPSSKPKLGLVLAAAAAAALLFVEKPAEFLSRGSGLPVQRAEVFVYRMSPGQAGQAVGSSMRSTDELAFAYVNPAGFSRLMIFGEDEHGHVYWYHPAWLRETDDPLAIPVGSGPELRELPESVAHELDGKTLTSRSIFTNAELSARDVESLLARQRAAADSGAGSALSTLMTGIHEIQLTVAVE